MYRLMVASIAVALLGASCAAFDPAVNQPSSGPCRSTPTLSMTDSAIGRGVEARYPASWYGTRPLYAVS